MNFQDFSKSIWGTRLALAIGSLPPALGYRLGNKLANTIAYREQSSIVQSIRLNQWIIRGKKSTSEQLDRAVEAVLSHAARCMFDFYHDVHAPKRILQRFHFNQQLKDLIKLSQENKFGAMVVGPHLSNFDYAMLAMGYKGLKAQVLSFAQPTGGYQWQNRIREKSGLELTPIDPKSLFHAVEKMRQGGFVLTGVDRPVPGKLATLDFFGEQAPLPVGHVRLAMEAKVPIIVIATQFTPEGNYTMQVSEPIPIESRENRKQTIQYNAQKVLGVLEGFIRLNPEHWLMYYPVWPALMKSLS